MLPASILRKVSAATIMNMKFEMQRVDSIFPLQSSEQPTCARFPHSTNVNSFRGEKYVLLLMSGDTKCEVHIAAIAIYVPYVCWDIVKTEASIEPLGTKEILFCHANPNRGNEVGIKPV